MDRSQNSEVRIQNKTLKAEVQEFRRKNLKTGSTCRVSGFFVLKTGGNYGTFVKFK